MCPGSPASGLQAEWVWWGSDRTLLFCNHTNELQTGGDQGCWCDKSLFSVSFSCSCFEADTLIWTSGTVCSCLDWSSWWEADSRRTLSVKYLVYITADRLLKHATCLSAWQALKPTCSDMSLTEDPLWSKCFSLSELCRSAAARSFKIWISRCQHVAAWILYIESALALCTQTFSRQHTNTSQHLDSLM